jgi:hypothetical protein
MRLIRALVIILILLLSPSGEGFSREAGSNQIQNEIYFPIIFNSLINKLPPTATQRPTQTRTPTRTRVPFRSATPRPTATQTPTSTHTPTVTRTPTFTATITLIPFPSVTILYRTQTPSITPSPTRSPTITPRLTPQPGIISRISQPTWIIPIFLSLLWIAFVVLLYYYFRNRN